MPNWCSNTIEVIGVSDELEKFIKAITIPEEEVKEGYEGFTGREWYDFTRLFPCPQELKETDASYGIPKSPEHEAQMKSNVEKYGHEDWYEWQCANWGTKWSPSEINIFMQTPNYVAFSCQSAWSPPSGLIAMLSKLFPRLGFVMSYNEGGMCFLGSESYYDGDSLYEASGEYNDHEIIVKAMKAIETNEDENEAYSDFDDAVTTMVDFYQTRALDVLFDVVPSMLLAYPIHNENEDEDI